ncbi:MAG TPA: hypothetical protein VEI52_11010 [Terriglobales bacterium]|nr:hypothetical protein [Terriglobales bacterium]
MPADFTRRSLIKTMAGSIAAGILSNTGVFGQQQQDGSQLGGYACNFCEADLVIG